MPQDLDGVSPTHVLGNTYTDLSLGFRPCSGPCSGPSPCHSWSRSPWRTLSTIYGWDSHPLTIKPLWNSGFQQRRSSMLLEKANKHTHVCVYMCVCVYVSMSLGSLEREWITFWLYLYHPTPNQYVSVPRDTLLASDFSCMGHWCRFSERLLRSVWLPQLSGTPRGPFLSHSIQSTELWAAWLGVERGWKSNI